MKNSVTQETIDQLLAGSEIHAETIFDKATIVAVKLPSGFVLTESSGAVDSANYDKEIGKSICLDKIKDKLWELEGYRLQTKLQEDK